MAQRRARPDRGGALLMRGLHHSASLVDPEEARPRPMHPGDPPDDPGQRWVTLAPIFEPIIENIDRMHLPMPFANQLGAGLQRDGGNASRPASLVRSFLQ